MWRAGDVWYMLASIVCHLTDRSERTIPAPTTAWELRWTVLQTGMVLIVNERTMKYRPGSGQVMSGMEAYAGAARRRVHLAPVLLRPPSGHRPGRRQARHARILQIGLYLTQP